ncbi:hypothetical protein D3C73_1196690 [compost metagenome]
MDHGLDIAEPGGTGRLHLSFGDCHNTCPDRLRDERRGVHRQTNRPGLEAVERKAQCRRAIVKNIHNEQQRNIADELDVARAEPAQPPHRRDPEDRDDRPQQEAADQGQHAGENRPPEALQVRAEIAG